MVLLQFLIIILIIIILVKTADNFRKNKISLPTFLFWLALWLIILVVAFFPQLTGFLAELLGVRRGVDVIIYLSIISIFFILFRIIIRLEKIKQEITEIVRHLSLKEPRKK